LNKEKIKNYIFDKWTRGNFNTTDIEFYNFFAKFINLNQEEAASTQEIVAFYHALLQKHKETEPQFKTYESTEDLMDYIIENLRYSHKQRGFYRPNLCSEQSS